VSSPNTPGIKRNCKIEKTTHAHPAKLQDVNVSSRKTDFLKIAPDLQTINCWILSAVEDKIDEALTPQTTKFRAKEF
jgi:dihydroorotate dehydrogenase